MGHNEDFLFTCVCRVVCLRLTCCAAGVLYSTTKPCSSPFSFPGGTSHIISTSVPFSTAVTLTGGFSGTETHTKKPPELKGISLLSHSHGFIICRVFTKNVAQGVAACVSKIWGMNEESAVVRLWARWPEASGPGVSQACVVLTACSLEGVDIYNSWREKMSENVENSASLGQKKASLGHHRQRWLAEFRSRCWGHVEARVSLRHVFLFCPSLFLPRLPFYFLALWSNEWKKSSLAAEIPSGVKT